MLRQLLTRRITHENRDDMSERDWELLEPHLKRAGYRLRTFRDIRDADEGEFGATYAQEEISRELLDRVAPSQWSIIQFGYREEEAFIFKCFKNMRHSREEVILRYLNQDYLRNQSENLTIDLQRFFDALEHRDCSYKLMVLPYEGEEWSEVQAPSFRIQAEQYQQVFSYLAFLHHNGIAHLDLSDRNVIYNKRTRQLKFIDFELSVLRRPQGFPLRSSPWYSQIPSVLVGDWPEDSSSKHFDPFAADVWSIGNMLLNELPDKRRMHPIPGFENLLKSMMAEEPRKRPTAEQALAAFRHLLCDMIFNHTLTLASIQPEQEPAVSDRGQQPAQHVLNDPAAESACATHAIAQPMSSENSTAGQLTPATAETASIKPHEPVPPLALPPRESNAIPSSGPSSLSPSPPPPQTTSPPATTTAEPELEPSTSVRQEEQERPTLVSSPSEASNPTALSRKIKMRLRAKAAGKRVAQSALRFWHQRHQR